MSPDSLPLALVINSITLLLLTSPAAGAEKSQCTERTVEEKLELRKSLLETTEMHETFYQMDGLREAFPAESLAVFKRKRIGPHRVHHAPIDSNAHRRLNCSDQREYETEEGNVTDPCPFSWLLNVDQHRIPETMLEARCLPCRHCLKANEARDITQCADVVYYTRVLRKTYKCDAAGQPFNYVPVWEPITTGCACLSQPKKAGTLPTGTAKSSDIPPI